MAEPGASSRSASGSPAPAGQLATSQARLTIATPGSSVWTLVKVHATSSPAVIPVTATASPSRVTSRGCPFTVQPTELNDQPSDCCADEICSATRTVAAGASGRSKRTVYSTAPDAPVTCGPAGSSCPAPAVRAAVKVQPLPGPDAPPYGSATLSTVTVAWQVAPLARFSSSGASCRHPVWK